MPTVNEIIQDESVAHAVSLQQYSLGVVRKIIATLNRSDARLMVALAEALDQMPAESFTVERLESLLASVREVNAAAYAQVAQELGQELKDLASYELNWQYQLFQTTIPAPVQVHFPIAQVTVEQAYAAAMSRPFQGRLLRDWASTIESDRLAKVRNAVRQGYMEGKTVAQIVSEIRGTRANNYADGFLQRPRKDLETVVRTAISHTAATARQEFTSANSDIIKAERWVSTLDTKTSAQCFPGSTLVLPIGELRGVTRRPWNGDLIVITTAGGKQLRSTPNHPVLTARGWRAAHEIEPGADVLYRVTGDVGGVSSSEDIHMPATFGAVFDALNKPSFSDVLVERATKVDFHGDGMAGYYEINQPRSESHLRLALEASIGKKASEEFLVLVAESGRLSRFGDVDEFVFGERAANMAAEFDAGPVEDRVKARLAYVVQAAYIGRRHAVDKELGEDAVIASSGVIAAMKSLHNTSSFEDAGDCCGADGESLGDAAGRLPIGVIADDVVAVRREFFSGHVHNLSTDASMYIADGFVVHNCRIRDQLQYTAETHKPIGHRIPWLQGPGKLHFNCRSTSSPVTKSWRELGIPLDEMTPSQRASMDGQVPADQDYNQWLSKQSDARIEQVLGPERFQLYKSGGIKLDDFYSPTGQWYTIDQLKQRDEAAFSRIAA